MKYPALLPFAEILQQLDQFDAVIDTRSPSEFAEDHIPGAINCPVLDDEERKRIGTLYRQVNSFEAKKLGAALVARNIAQHIESRFLEHGRDWKPLIYCWRGGNRSAAMAHILARIGWPAVQLDGGYKEFRRHVISALENLPKHFTYLVVCGPTGSGKSRLLQTLASEGAQVLDLEKLAAHRGSILGFLPGTPQPSQKAFESALWQAFRRFDPDIPIFIEAESRKVGNLRLPQALTDAMRGSPCIQLTLPLPQRVALLMQDYRHFIDDPVSLNIQLDCLLTLHGREKIGRWQALASSGQIETLVEELLRDHYDPSYTRSVERNFAQIAQARQLSLDQIGTADFLRAARTLIATEPAAAQR
jgi:tRNA 2-selenouridine synthase